MELVKVRTTVSVEYTVDASVVDDCCLHSTPFEHLERAWGRARWTYTEESGLDAEIVEARTEVVAATVSATNENVKETTDQR